MLFCAPAWFCSICMLGGLLSAFSVWWDTYHSPPLFGGASPLITPPTLSCWFPVQCYSQGYWYLMWAFPLLLKGLGVFPHHLGRFGGHISSSAVHMLILVHFLWCIMSHVLTTAPATTPPVTVVSSGLSSVSPVTVAPSLTGFPVSHGMVPPPPLIPRGSGGVLGSVSVLQQQTSSSMLPLAYANYAMGSPQVGFFFRVEPPTILYLIYVWCLFWCLVFTFRCQIGCHIHLSGLNH